MKFFLVFFFSLMFKYNGKRDKLRTSTWARHVHSLSLSRLCVITRTGSTGFLPFGSATSGYFLYSTSVRYRRGIYIVYFTSENLLSIKMPCFPPSPQYSTDENDEHISNLDHCCCCYFPSLSSPFQWGSVCVPVIFTISHHQTKLAHLFPDVALLSYTALGRVRPFRDWFLRERTKILQFVNFYLKNSTRN